LDGGLEVMYPLSDDVRVTVTGRMLRFLVGRRWAPTQLQALLTVLAVSEDDPEGSAALSYRRLAGVLSTSASVAGSALRELVTRKIVRGSASPASGGASRYAVNPRLSEWELEEKIGGAKERILAEANGRCSYCGRKVAPKELQLDHRVPISIGGRNTPDNLAPVCRRCNRKKDVLGPAEFFRTVKPGRKARPGEVACPLLGVPCPVGGPPSGGGHSQTTKGTVDRDDADDPKRKKTYRRRKGRVTKASAPRPREKGSARPRSSDGPPRARRPVGRNRGRHRGRGPPGRPGAG